MHHKILHINYYIDIDIELLQKLNRNNNLVLIKKKNICLGPTPLKKCENKNTPNLQRQLVMHQVSVTDNTCKGVARFPLPKTQVKALQDFRCH